MLTIRKPVLVAWLFPGIAFLSCAQEENERDVPVTTSVKEEPISSPLRAVGVADLPEQFQAVVEPWTGDFDVMVERRVIRALVVFSEMHYFLDGEEQKGIAYEALKRFEEEVNLRPETRRSKVHVVIIPVSRDQLIPALLEGRGDIAAANLTITQEHSKQVDFSDPFLTSVSEVVVTGPGAPAITSLNDLAGKQIPVRASSACYESLRLLSRLLEVRGRRRLRMTLIEEYLEDEDLLEMVNAGLIPIAVVDSHKAEFWDQIFDDITVHSTIAVASGGEIAWAFRKDSPKLSDLVNAFVKKNKNRIFVSSIPFKEYLRGGKWVENSLSDEGLERLQDTIALFRKYGGEYDFDWLMLAALGYEESRLQQSLRGAAGAIGVMQIPASVAADPNVNIPNVENLENNIHAGAKYLRYLRDRYFDEEDMDLLDRNLFTFASYKGGAEQVAALRRKAAGMGLDRNRWFQNVEVVAAREMGRETVQYVSNIAKYYVAYRRFVPTLRKKGWL